jgi:SAM-dependent methyltransferase
MGAAASSDAEWIARYAQQLQNSLGRNGCLLELGSGKGRDTIDLVSFGDVVAVDLSEQSLRGCRKNVPGAWLVQADLSRPLPFRSGGFSAVIASLCLHYFTWRISLQLVAEIHRVMAPGSLLIVRLNSTLDVHHGAVGHPEIEPGLFMIDRYPKRFFDRRSVVDLFSDWKIDSMEERVIMRYDDPKWVWELSLYAG